MYMIVRMSWSDAGNNYYNAGNTPIQTPNCGIAINKVLT